MASTTAPTAASAASTNHGRAGSAGLVGTVLALGSGAMLTTAVCAAYLSVRNRNASSDFIPATMPFNNYVAVMITFSLVIASLAVGWAVVSTRVAQRRWGSTGFAFAAFLDLAALNLLWWLGKDSAQSVDSSPYAVLFYAMLAVAGALLVAGLIASIAGVARVLGGHASPRELHHAVASSWVQHLALAAWVAVYATIYWLK